MASDHRLIGTGLEAVSAVDVGVGPWKGSRKERRAGGSAVACDEFIKPADDGGPLG
jgi:hypothetical protein